MEEERAKCPNDLVPITVNINRWQRDMLDKYRERMELPSRSVSMRLALRAFSRTPVAQSVLQNE